MQSAALLFYKVVMNATKASHPFNIKVCFDSESFQSYFSRQSLGKIKEKKPITIFDKKRLHRRSILHVSKP